MTRIAIVTAEIVLLGLTASAAAQETPTRPRFSEELERVHLACGRLDASLPTAIVGGPTCPSDEPLPSAVLGRDRLEISLEPDFVELVLFVEETPASPRERETRRAEWSTWPRTS